MKIEVGCWETVASALRDHGETAKLIDVLRHAADAGEVEARAMLAKEYFWVGQFKEASEALEICEREVREDDFKAHWQLHKAYFIGAGNVGLFDRLKLGVHHLETAAALSGIPQLLMEIAGYYEGGLNGVQKDLGLAERWLRQAVETGNEEAATRHRRVLSKLRKAKLRPVI